MLNTKLNRRLFLYIIYFYSAILFYIYCWLFQTVCNLCTTIVYLYFPIPIICINYINAQLIERCMFLYFSLLFDTTMQQYICTHLFRNITAPEINVYTIIKFLLFWARVRVIKVHFTINITSKNFRRQHLSHLNINEGAKLYLCSTSYDSFITNFRQLT